MPEPVDIALQGLRIAIRMCHEASVRAGWWSDRAGQRIMRNRGEMIALIHSELSEALEAERKNLMDEHLPQRRGAEVELADAVIRIFDYCGAHGYDLSGAIFEKLAFNAQRPDHKPHERAKEGGKKF